MKLIAGLGNPGDKYDNTRHNLGFMVVDRFLKEFESNRQTFWETNPKLKSQTVLLDWQPKKAEPVRVLLAKPQTFMNNSGMAISLITSFYKIDPDDVWIVHDELDLPIGSMRIRFGGAAAGHRGVESVMESLGTDKFWRFRLGIGASFPHEGRALRESGKEHPISKQSLGNMEKFVLSNFSQEDHGKARELIKHASEAMQYALEKNLEAAMNRYNTK